MLTVYFLGLSASSLAFRVSCLVFRVLYAGVHGDPSALDDDLLPLYWRWSREAGAGSVSNRPLTSVI